MSWMGIKCLVCPSYIKVGESKLIENITHWTGIQIGLWLISRSLALSHALSFSTDNYIAVGYYR